MCCFSQPVVSVSDTNLFARHASDSRQYLVYQMKFESKTNNAMILPLPVATPTGEDAVRFISLKEYETFFDDMSKGFPYIPPTDLVHARSGGVHADSMDMKLAVHEVGDFIASFVPTMDDFSRLDEQFVIPRESWDKIPGYSDFGFAVFQLKELKGKPHPMAFEFETRFNEKLFFPTVHIHDGEVHEREEFDHTLYLQHEKFDQAVGNYQNRRVKDRATGFVRSKWKARGFCKTAAAKDIVDPQLLVHRLEMIGKFENKDIEVDFARNFTATNRWWPRLWNAWPVVPAAAAVGCFGWLIKRRNKIRSEMTSKNEKSEPQ